MFHLTPEQTAKKIVAYCNQKGIKYLFISGNGASGKTELSKIICQVASSEGVVNIIDMDDFVVDTKLRSNAKIEWTDSRTGEIRSGKYSTVFSASYFLQNIKAILCNLERGNNYWYWPKKAKSFEDCHKELQSNAVLTVIEGIGSVYLDKDPTNSLSIFIRCSKEIEIDRRVNRARFSNEQNRGDVEKQYEERNSQFEAIILPHASSHNLILESLADYSFEIRKDEFNVFQ